jgi:glutaredoxin
MAGGEPMNITIYTTSTCPFCNMLTDYLNGKNIQFTEKRVDADKEAEKEMMGISGGFLGVPFTVIEKDNNKETIIGFDQNKFDSVFSQI